MAYDTKNLNVLSYANGFTLWHYSTTDATVDTAGYFLVNVDTDGAMLAGLYLVQSNYAGVVEVSNLTVNHQQAT